jgi:hypothetical protein
MFYFLFWMIPVEALTFAPVSLSSCDILLSGEPVAPSIPLSLKARVDIRVPLADEVSQLVGALFHKAERPEISADDFLDGIRRELITVHMRLSQGDTSVAEDRKFLIDRISRRFSAVKDLNWCQISDSSCFTQDIGNLSRIRSSRGISDSFPSLVGVLADFRSVDVLVSAAPVLKAVHRDLWAREVLDHASCLVREGKSSINPEILEMSKKQFNGNYDWDRKFPFSPRSSPSPSPRSVEKIISDLRQERESRLRTRATRRVLATENERSIANSSKTFHSFPDELEAWEAAVLADLRELEK